MDTLLFIQENSYEMSQQVCHQLQKKYSVLLAKNTLDGLKKAETQSFKGICKLYETNEMGANNIASALKYSQLNRKTPIILLTKALQEAMITFHKYKNIHIIDISLDQDAISEKIYNFLHPEDERIKKVSLDASLINLFIKSSLNVLDTMGYAKDFTPLKPYAYKNKLTFTPHITAYAPVKTQSFNGFFGVSIPKVTYLKMAENLFNEPFLEINDDIKDLHLELINIIYGQVKKELTQLGYKLESLIPESCHKESTLLNSLKSGPSIIIPIKTSAGEIHISASLGQFKKS